MKIDHPTQARLPQLKELWRQAFGDEEAYLEAFFSRAYSPDRCRTVMEGETVAAMLYWLDAEFRGVKYAYLYAVATRPDFRGRGLCRALMEDTHRELSRRGYAGAILYPAGAALRRMYGKLGYRDCGRAGELTCKAGAPVQVREISREEYTALRREYLPEDGLIQEGESMELLAETANLYAGDGFLLAAVIEGKTLLSAELLGREEAAPGIVAALGCQKGTFRRGAVGMMHLLSPDAPLPGYLGLVFD